MGDDHTLYSFVDMVCSMGTEEERGGKGGRARYVQRSCVCLGLLWIVPCFAR